MDRDPYDVLGVSRSASDDELRKAYRSRARKYHPDVTTEADAEERFNEVQQAWEILSDPQKKAMFDQYGRVGPSPMGAGGGWGSSGGGRGAGGVQVDPGQFSEIFEEMFGGGGGFSAGSGRRAAQPAPRRGMDQRRDLHVTFVTAAKGGVEPVKLDHGDTVQLRIPPGIEDGGTLRLRGKGGPGRDSGEAGDLLVTVRIGGHPLYRRDGIDLLVDMPITIAEAALGVSIEASLLQGSVKVRIPPGTSSGTRLRVRGQGLKVSDEQVGDFYAVVHIVAPGEIDDEARTAIEALAQSLDDPRSAIDGLDTVSE